jgi:RHS repeat-associated protein
MGENYRITVTNPLGYTEEYYYSSVHGSSWYVSARDYVEYVDVNTNNYASAASKIWYDLATTSGTRGEIERMVLREGGYIQYGYSTDGNGNRTSVTDAQNHTTGYTYNDMGRVTSITPPKGVGATTLTYDTANNVDLEQISNGLGNITLTYNSTHDVTSITDQLNKTTSFTYNSYGQIATQTDPLNILTEYIYDTNHNLVQVQRDGNVIASFTYDAIGRVQTATDATGLTLTYTYNNLNHVTAISYPDGKSVTSTYSTLGPLLVDSITDRAGQTTSFVYDELKRLAGTTNPEGGITQYTYDANCNLHTVEDPENHLTTFDYDRDNRVVKKTYHDGKCVQWHYNSAGLLDRSTNARGITSEYSYDENDNLETITYSDSTPAVTYSYDDYDRLTGKQDGIGTWGFAYDNNSRLTAVDGPWNMDMLTYGYDDLGRRTSLTPQGGTALSYVYDTLNRLTTIQAGTASHVYTYTGVNPLVQSLTRPNGSVTTYQYNGVNQLTEIVNKTSVDEVLNQHVFTYNNLDLRGSETISGSALPAMPSLPEETKDYAYNVVNQLLSVTNPNLTFVYDDDGNMIQGYVGCSPLEGGVGGCYPFTTTYDAEDRMTSLEYTDSSSVVHRTEYRYSGDGFLAVIRKFENSSLIDEIRIVRDGFLAIQDRDGSNTVVREYTWGLNLGGGIGGLLNLKQGGQDYAYLYDGKGNVAAVLDGSQNVVAAYRYAPFGELLAQTGSLTQPFGFSTKRYDAQTGLIHYQYRPYAPAIGRWLTRDPLGEAGGMNLYAFVGNNPVNWVDPWGLELISWTEGEKIIKAGETWGKTPWFYGGSTKGENGGVDCSNFIHEVYQETGFPYPYTRARQFPNNPRFSEVFSPFLQPGDVAYFNGKHLGLYNPLPPSPSDFDQSPPVKVNYTYLSATVARGVVYAPLRWFEELLGENDVRYFRYDKPQSQGPNK